jgi:hypothetical protein
LLETNFRQLSIQPAWSADRGWWRTPWLARPSAQSVTAELSQSGGGLREQGGGFAGEALECLHGCHRRRRRPFDDDNEGLVVWLVDGDKELVGSVEVAAR